MVKTLDWLPTSGSDRVIIGVGSLLATIACWFLFFAPPTTDWESTSPEIGEVHAQGKIRRRHARVLQWEDISDESAVYLRDILYVPEGATATVVMKDGKQIQLAPESLVQFDDITVHEIEISLWEKVQQVARAKPKLFRLMPLPKPPRAGALPDLFPLITAFEDLTQRLEAVRKASLAIGKPPALEKMPRSAALRDLKEFDVQIVNPADGEKLQLNGERWMKMTWTPIPLIGVTYEILMSRFKDFRQTIPHQTQSTSVNVQFQDPGKYFWRVRVRRGAESIQSPVSIFEMVPGKAPNGRPIARPR